MFGIECKDKSKSSDFVYEKKEKITDPRQYLSNFNERAQKKQLSMSSVEEKVSGADAGDTEQVTKTFENWKKQMIEKGLFKG